MAGSAGWGRPKALPDEQRQPVQMITANIDVTDRKAVAETLRESEEKYKYLFESSVVGKAITYRSGRRQANQSFCELLGYTAKELRTVPWLDLVHPGDHEEGERTHAAMMAGERDAARFHRRFIRKDGGIVWADVSVSVRRDTAGAPRYFIITALDITERRRAGEARARLAAIVDSTSDGIISKTLEGVILTWNAGAEKLYGYGASEVVGRSIKLLQVPGTPDDIDEILKRVGEGRPFSHEAVRLHQDGSVIDVSLVVSPIRDETGEIAAISAIARNITDRKRAERQLAEQARQLARSNAELEQFAYLASHDLQEPLRMVASFTRLLGERYQDRLDERANKYINFAVDGAQRMQRLVNDLLEFSRVHTRGQRFAPVDCNQAMREVRQNLSRQIEEAGATVIYLDLPTIQADHGQIVQLLQNLISNAIKFRSEAAPIIEVRGAEQGGNWRFSVSDNGIGLDSRYAERIFVIFQRLHTREEYAGDGMGLAIAKKIVERHGGRIWVESQLGQGATFHWTVPMTQEEGTVPQDDRG